MVWILIVIIHAFGGGSAVAMQKLGPFPNPESCAFAGNAIHNSDEGYFKTDRMCIGVPRDVR